MAPRLNPFTGVTLAVDVDSQAAEFCAQNSGTPQAAAIQAIAAQPQAYWLMSSVVDLPGYIGQALANAGTGLIAFVVYNIPDRDNGGYASGGAGDFAGYKAYIDTIASACKDAAPVFLVEPDGFASSNELQAADLQLRMQCLAYAIETLADVGIPYLDIGHPGWHDAGTVATMLRSLGTSAYEGFAFNVSNFIGDAACHAYADRLLALTGKPSVYDTSRNGNGPAPGGEWCNPAGRKLGRLPLAFATSSIDANLWVKRPGESDGTCHGGPSAGVFWPDYAIGLL